MTRRVSHPLQLVVMSALVLAACFTKVVLGCLQGTPTAINTSTLNSPAFEVVSIRPTKPECHGMSSGGPPGRYIRHCVTLWGLIYNVYEVRSLQDHPAWLPTWADKDRFDVVVLKAKGDPPALQESR
jgi:hypothetical protein